MTKDEAMQMALTILLEYHEKENGLWGRTEDAIEALRTALAQPELEPVAWMYTEVGMDENRKVSSKILLRDYDTGVGIPLYTVPPQRKPLTDDEIFTALQGTNCERPLLVARAIEAAHGIKD